MSNSSLRRILCVDDDKENLKLLHDALVKEGFEVFATSSAREVLNKIGEWQPELVLMDRNMPEVNGLDLLKELRQKKHYVSVIFVSADSHPKQVSECLMEGADDYLRKPYSFVELIARIKVRFRFKQIHDELSSAVIQLREQAERDFLTGLYNMRNMYDKIDYELKRCRRYGGRVGCIMIDMDHFKTVNDKHDHLFGSYVLKEVGKIIQNNIRETDIAARYGGDEFLIVVTESTDIGVKNLCERVRKKIEGTLFQSGVDSIRLTSSLGYCLSDPKNDVDARTLVRVADHALYEAKGKGRNCFVGYDTPVGHKGRV